MKKSLICAIAWLSLSLLFSIPQSNADESEFSEFNPRPSCSKNLCCNSYDGVIADAELTLLTPHTGSLAAGAIPTILPEREMGVGGRYTLGYRYDSGLGYRVRYWHFNQSNSELGIGGITQTLTAQTFDGELTQLFTRGRYVFDISGGVRWANVDNSVGGPLFRDQFEGWGTTLAASARRQLADGPLSLYGSARGSLLFGEHSTPILGFPVVAAQEVMPVIETQLGVEYNKSIWGNTHAFLRTGFEAQLWELPPTVIGLLDQNIGFAGVTFATGLRY